MQDRGFASLRLVRRYYVLRFTFYVLRFTDPMQLTITGISGIPEIRPGDDLAGLVLARCASTGVALREGDILVVTQKVVSKAEGRLVDLRQVEPSEFALDYAKRWGKDPRQIEV